jgi:MscS family membrane protein
MSDIDRRVYLAVVFGACLLTFCGTVQAQTPAAPESQRAPVQDPLGRESPFGTMTGFSKAVHRNDFATAGQYLQLGPRQTPGQIEALARDLSRLLDRHFTEALTTLSMTPSGDVTDGLAINRERIHLAIGAAPVDLFLTQIADPGVGPIWLFSSDSLAGVPALRRAEQQTWLERVMPATLVDRVVLGLSLAQWIVWAGSIVLPLVLFSLVASLVATVGRRRIRDSQRQVLFESWWHSVRWLLVIGLTVVVHLSATRLLEFSLTFRVRYARIGLVLMTVIAALLIWRLISVTLRQAGEVALRHGRSDTRSLIKLGERVVKVVVILVATFALLSLAGVDLTTALAGVGIAGVAVALGAQKTIENLLGGIFLLTDRALAVGDYCRLSDREGWIEDVTLRSVRLRTLEQTLLSVPAGQLAQGSIENFATRRKILVQTILRLRYSTTAAQLHTVLADTRALLDQHAGLDRQTARFRLVAFGPQAIELELFVYVITSNFTDFLEVREELLLQIAHIVEAAGSAFAIPMTMVETRAALSGADENPAAHLRANASVGPP